MLKKHIICIIPENPFLKCHRGATIQLCFKLRMSQAWNLNSNPSNPNSLNGKIVHLV